MSQETGILIEWNDERAYGFVRTPSGERLFLHISEIAPMANRPRLDDRVTFQRGKGRDARPAAIGARIMGANPVSGRAPLRGAPRQDPRRSLRVSALPIIAACVIAAFILLGLAIGRVPVWLAGIYAFMGLVSFGAYYRDKTLAQAGQWRISEANLHGVDALGGIVGGLLGQQVFRHKTSKPGFVLRTTLIAGLHILCLGALCLAPF